MKARDQKRQGFYCWNRMGTGMQYRRSPSTSEKLVYNNTNKKWRNYWATRKWPCSPAQKWVSFHLTPAIMFYKGWINSAGANLAFPCGSQKTQEGTEVGRRCNIAQCLLGRGDRAVVASRAQTHSCLSLHSFCLWSFMDNLPRSHAMHPAVTQPAPCDGVCETKTRGYITHMFLGGKLLV